ncbi:PAS domain S-box protein [Halovenus halobia]|uniref:PAS domain S-box protein n=1 Tax=Halovenus halobia TaxID=3396622 RepID=UPI003F57BDE3
MSAGAAVDDRTDQLAATTNTTVTTVDSVAEAMSMVRSADGVDCIISDQHLPETDGIAFLEAVRAQRPHLPFILCTEHGSEELASRAISANVTEYLVADGAEQRWGRLADLATDAIRSARRREQLFEPHNRARTLLNATRDTVAVIQDGDLAYLNAAGRELFGVGPDEPVTARPVESVISAVDDTITSALEAVAAGREPVARRECTLERDGGVRIPVEFTLTEIEWAGEPSIVFVARNVSERKHSEYELQRFRKAVESAGHAIYITDTDGTITYVNPAFERITGYDSAEAIGNTPKILQSGEMSDEYYQRLWTDISAGEYWEEEIINERRNGDLYHANQTIAPVTNDDGDVEQFVAMQTDITERTEAKRDLERYRKMVQHLDDPIALYDRDGNFAVVNDALAGLAGCPREDLVGSDESAFLTGDAPSMFAQYRDTVRQTSEPFEIERRITTRTGTDATYNIRWYPYYDADGDFVGTLAIWRDVTERKQRKEELKQYEQAVTGSTDLIAATDEQGQFRFANPKYCRYHGLDPNAVTDLTLQSLFADREGYEQLQNRVARALDGNTVKYRTTRVHPTRGERTLDVRYYPLSDDGTISGVVAVLRDVTDRTNRAKQLRVVDRVLRHNLRNDLTAIRLRTQELGAAPEAERSELVTEILDTADGLLTTSEKSRSITDILADPPEVRQRDVGAEIRRRVDSLRTTYPHADVAFSGDHSATAIATQSLGEAIAELLTNAVVHHDGDRPTIDVHVSTQPETVEIRLTDDGPGIPPMDQDVLLTGRDSDELYHGSGLGLWLVYWVVQRSGGDIDIADGDPRGTTITLTLPRRPS